MTGQSDDFVVQVVLMSDEGKSILDAEGPVTAETVSAFGVGDERIAVVRAELEKLGLSVLQGDRTTLSVGGPSSLVEEVFGLDTSSSDAALPAHAAKIPETLSGYVADVFAAPKPELFF